MEAIGIINLNGIHSVMLNFGVRQVGALYGRFGAQCNVPVEGPLQFADLEQACSGYFNYT